MKRTATSVDHAVYWKFCKAKLGSPSGAIPGDEFIERWAKGSPTVLMEEAWATAPKGKTNKEYHQDYLLCHKLRFGGASGCTFQNWLDWWKDGSPSISMVEAGWENAPPVPAEPSVPTNDQVNSPAHYTTGGMETIDVIKAKLTPDEFRGYLLGAILKYTTRFNHKGKPKQDLLKAQWYLARLIDEVEAT